jgi:uncharacterized protein (TIGR00730 family)
MNWRRWGAYWHFTKDMFTINWRLFYGMWRLTRLPQPAITVFGGSRISKDNPYSNLAYELSKKLANEGFSIITGGGQGIMEAANQGAFEFAQEKLKECKGWGCNHRQCKKRLVTIGIGVVRLGEEKMNPYTHDIIIMDHFFSRKWMLVRYSIGFVVFPGGFGTMDELFETITLIQTQRMAPMPILLMGKEYWEPLTDWITDQWLKRGLISHGDEKIINVVDCADDAIEIIKKRCKICE